MKKVVVSAAIFILVIVIIVPSIVVLPFISNAENDKPDNDNQQKVTQEKTTPPGPAVTVSVYRKEADKIDHLSFRDYLVGVVASEMPANFHIEALKAQALAARTFIVKELLSTNSKSDLPKGAEVADTVMYQVFKDREDLQRIWGADYEWKIEKIEKAVASTSKQIITYDGKVITPTFFSTSNGYTENSEDYWINPRPYLKSVKSPWDKNSPKFFERTTIPVDTVEASLNVNIPANAGLIGTILKETEGHRIGKIKIAGSVFSGREVRKKLDLRSTDFKLKKEGNTVYVKTWGFGHGVGMSQYGANGMAKNGHGYKEIINYYYQGVDITKMDEKLIGRIKEPEKV